MAILEDWEREAPRIIKAAMRRRGITHKMLAKELAKQGIHLEEQSLANKLNRRSLTFACALLVMRLLHVDHIEVPKL
jgi:lambda repressor-like predicted transcriptional regulator